MNLDDLIFLHKAMNESKKLFFDSLSEYEKENGKAVAGSIIKSTSSTFKGRKFKVFEVNPSVNVFSSNFDISTYYRAKLLDGKGNEIHGKVVKFYKDDFDVIER